MTKNHSNIDLSVIIVNYNVEYFLEQCLNSVYRAVEAIKIEVFVVDNNSVDGSTQMVKDKFPNVVLIENKTNQGFSKANNQAIKMAKGRNILLLNPDTVVEESTFSKVVQFMDKTNDAGGLGVRMVDGRGNFLPESKRGLPTPKVAFFKIFGLSQLFPKSRIFGTYHLGYLSENQTNKVDVLSGAFLCFKKEIVEKTGLLDETFFMYGEDIDFSYRITKSGYNNYYYPETTIIHYKGESTKKSSVNYVFIFYKAMVIFAQKHFSKKNAKIFSFAIHLAIYFRAFLALLNRFIKFSTPLVIDGAIIFVGLVALTNHWGKIDIHFPKFVYNISIPIYTLVWMLSSLFFGVYDKEDRVTSILKSTIFGTLVILVFYGLLPKEWQFSRVFILLGSAWVISAHLIKKCLVNLFKHDTLRYKHSKIKNFIIVGDAIEGNRVSDLLKNTYLNIGNSILVSDLENINPKISAIIHGKQPNQGVYNEVIFCAKSMNPSQIISCMTSIGKREIDFKIAQPDTSFIIGSNSIDSKGDYYSMKINSINRPGNLRSKRLFDILLSLIFIMTLPLSVWFFKHKWKLVRNLIHVFFGQKSFVGYHFNEPNEPETNLLPNLKKGVLTPLSGIQNLHKETIDQMNLIYAKEYSIFNDVVILIKKWRFLDL
jgi:GT2 family glycosyltransferase